MSGELDNLVKANILTAEPANRAEYDGLLDSGRKRLADATGAALSQEGRFDLAYNAAFALALAALRRQGYRPHKNRYAALQALVHTTPGIGSGEVQIFLRAHNARNLAEYEGRTDVDAKLLHELIRCAAMLEKTVTALDPPADE